MEIEELYLHRITVLFCYARATLKIRHKNLSSRFELMLQSFKHSVMSQIAEDNVVRHNIAVISCSWSTTLVLKFTHFDPNLTNNSTESSESMNVYDQFRRVWNNWKLLGRTSFLFYLVVTCTAAPNISRILVTSYTLMTSVAWCMHHCYHY